MVGFGNDTFAGMKGLLPPGGSGDCQLADPYIHTDHVGMHLGDGISDFDLKGNQQVELLLGLIIPELCCPDMSTMVKQGHMLMVACVGDHHTPVQGEDAHLVIFLQAVVPMEVVGERGGDVLGGVVQALVPLPGDARLACLGILLYPREDASCRSLPPGGERYRPSEQADDTPHGCVHTSRVATIADCSSCLVQTSSGSRSSKQHGTPVAWRAKPGTVWHPSAVSIWQSACAS